jgi:hypothetical protein
MRLYDRTFGAACDRILSALAGYGSCILSALGSSLLECRLLSPANPPMRFQGRSLTQLQAPAATLKVGDNCE